VNISHMINESKDSIASTLIDVEKAIPNETLDQILSIDGLIKARLI